MSHRTTSRRALLIAAVVLAALPSAAGAVTGGTPAPAGQGTFAAALVSSDALTTVAAGQFCGATFVRDDALITAAHCVVEDAGDEPAPGDVRVFSGRSMPLGAGRLLKVAQITVHPSYDDGRGESNADVAVLRLAKPVTGVLAAALPTPADVGGWLPGQPITVLGWGNRAFVDGTTSEDVNLPRQLQQGGVTRFTDARCDDLYGRYYNPTTQLCAGLPQGGVDACNGDSGGPLVAGRPDGRAVLVGIVSYGEGCGRALFPTVYTKVARYEAWISAQLAKPVRTLADRQRAQRQAVRDAT